LFDEETELDQPVQNGDTDESSITPLSPETISFAVEMFSALAHSTRLRIINLLTCGGLTVGEIAAGLDILQPNASQHLAILQRAGIIKVTPHGAQRVYAVRGPRIARILLLVNEFRNIHRDALTTGPAAPDVDLAESDVP
jgi:DNA-binding transcriptional ArsR family regulator